LDRYPIAGFCDPWLVRGWDLLDGFLVPVGVPRRSQNSRQVVNLELEGQQYATVIVEVENVPEIIRELSLGH